MTTFEELYEKAPVAYHELDTEGVIQRVNEAECELLGYTREELIGQPVWNFIAAEEIEDGRAALRDKLQHKRGIAPRRRTYVSKHGQYLTVELRDRLIHAPDGKVEGIRSTLVDITELARREADTAENQHWQVAILQTLPEAIVAVDGLGVVAHMNRSAEQLTGWELPDARGEAFERVLQLSGLSVAPWCDVPLSGMFHRCLFEAWHGTATLISRRGEMTKVRVHSMPLGQEGDRVTGFVLVVSLTG